MLKRDKTIFIRLTKATNGTYRIEQLKNAAKVQAGIVWFRVGDWVTTDQADTLCEDQNYEVTITT